MLLLLFIGPVCFWFVVNLSEAVLIYHENTLTLLSPIPLKNYFLSFIFRCLMKTLNFMHYIFLLFRRRRRNNNEWCCLPLIKTGHAITSAQPWARRYTINEQQFSISGRGSAVSQSVSRPQIDFLTWLLILFYFWKREKCYFSSSLCSGRFRRQPICAVVKIKVGFLTGVSS